MVRVSTSAKERITLPTLRAFTSEDRLRFFTKVTQAISSDLELEKTLYAIVDEVFDYFKPRGVSIMVRQGDKIRIVARRSQSQKLGPEQSPRLTDIPFFKVGEGVVGQAVLTGQPVQVSDTLEDPRFIKPVGKSSRIRSILCVPMKAGGRVTGAISVSYAEPHIFSEDEVTTLQIISTPAAYSIQNATLFERIEHERQTLELIQTSMRNGLTVNKLDGTLIFVNQATKDMFGIAGDVTGESLMSVLSGKSKHLKEKINSHESVSEIIDRVSRGKAVTSMIDVLHDQPRHIESIFSPLPDSRGKTVAIIGNHRDVTELVRKSEEVERQLQQVASESGRFQAIFDNVEEAIVLTDRDGKIIQANPSTTILSGLDRKELVGKGFSYVFPLENSRGISLTGNLSPGRTILTTKESIDYLEAKFVNSEGREVWLGISATPLMFDDKDPSNDQIVFVMRDISRLKEIDQAKSDFVSMASHELRTPLTIINGYISLFMNGDLGDINDPALAHYRTVFSQIQKSTDRLNKLVEDLLNVSRIEQGRLNLTLEKINLELLVRDVIEEMDRHAKNKNHRLEFISSPTSFLDLPPVVKIDHGKIKEVLINLIDNAVKYTEPGGVITVTLKKDRQDIIVSIRDTGVGIPRQLIPRVFEKFQRLEGSYVKDTVGTGLGLYIVRELVRAHGGRVWVESTIGQGSTFSFSLPRNRD